MNQHIPDASRHEKVDRTLGNYLSYAFTIASLLAVLAVHLPWLPTPAQAAGHSFSNLIGQEHRWTMFSADPRGQALDLWAVLEHPDGSQTEWSIRDESPGNELRVYRWVKWMETGVLRQPQRQLVGLAGWLEATSAKPVSKVTVYGLVREPGVVGGVRPDPEVSVLLLWDHRNSEAEVGEVGRG